MIASFVLRSSHVRRSLLGGLANNANPLQNTSPEATCGILLSQRRGFIQMQSRLKVVDNSGAKMVKCIGCMGARKHGGRLGDMIVGSVREAYAVKVPKGVMKKVESVKKGDVVYGVLVRTAMPKVRKDGSQIRFFDNAVVIVKAHQPVGTRVLGPVPHELRRNSYSKVLTLAKAVV